MARQAAAGAVVCAGPVCYLEGPVLQALVKGSEVSAAIRSVHVVHARRTPLRSCLRSERDRSPWVGLAQVLILRWHCLFFQNFPILEFHNGNFRLLNN